MSENNNVPSEKPYKKKPFKNPGKKTLNQEMKESGLTKSEFFKTKFSKKRSRKKSPSDTVSNRGTYGETTAQKKAKELEDAATAFLNRASYEEARSSYKNKSHKESSDKKTYRKETPSRDYSKDRGARPLDIGMFIHAHIVEILTDTGNSYLSAMGDHKGKQIFMEHVPDIIEIGNTVVVKLTAHRKKLWYGQMIRILPDTNMLIGVFNASEKTILPIHRKRDFVPVPCDVPLQDQMVVVFEEKDGIVHVREQIGLITSPKSYSKVAAFSQGVWKTITPEEEAFCQHFKVPGLKDSKGHMRDDLRDLDLVTIDGADAKDFDDAVWAAPDEDPRNEGGYRIVVAIADVSYYVREGDVLDQKAQNRGNSVYFPDYVLPMLPEGLSNDLCSLKPNVDRACLVADMIITKNGKLKHAHFKRALMRSKARLTYDEVEKALMGKVNKNVEPVFHSTILPLANAYTLLREARDERGSLNIHSFEHQILFDKEGHVKDVTVRPELKSNQLIEEMMVLANIAVAKALKNRDYPCMYRIHPAPDGTKVQNLKIFTKALNLPSPKSDNPTPHDFNRVLSAVEGGPYESLMNDLILRCQSQAQYNAKNQGHFGLGLEDYCHFTSPIRRYADLIVHRLMIDLFDLGEGGYKYSSLDTLAEHISTTERQAVAAEREADERFLASYLSNHIGQLFDAVIVGVNPSGLFVELSSKHAEAFIPKRLLLAMTHRASSYFDSALHALRVGHITYQLGMRLTVELVEADPITCQIICQPVPEDEKKVKGPKLSSGKKESKQFERLSKKMPQKHQNKDSKNP